MPTHRSWSKKANRHLKQIFKVTTDQTRLDASKEQGDRIAANYKEQYDKATDAACEDKYNRECGAYHDYIVRTIGPARTCETAPLRVDLDISELEPSILDQEICEGNLFGHIWPPLL